MRRRSYSAGVLISRVLINKMTANEFAILHPRLSCLTNQASRWLMHEFDPVAEIKTNIDEHLGSIEIMQQMVDQDGQIVTTKLASLAQWELKDGYTKDAADLRRAAEHLRFAASSSGSSKDAGIDSHLERPLLTNKAEQHWEEKRMSRLCHDALQEVAKAGDERFQARSLRQASEFAHAAEALAHLKKNRFWNAT